MRDNQDLEPEILHDNSENTPPRHDPLPNNQSPNQNIADRKPLSDITELFLGTAPSSSVRADSALQIVPRTNERE